MSNAGKSLLAAGLCRIFKQDGYRVAPFKSQNMALNSYVTAEGLEMGRAQVMQAEAAGILPDVRMNPVLLKPTTDIGSQVIVRGEVLGDMDARRYFAYKKSLMPMILESYQSLAEENDIIVIEGAGSPAEINLKQEDIVNMGLAKAVGAPVLLVGDIDLGGVFAQLLGTQMLLDPDEQLYLKGLIINKFRGDKSILDPGIRMLEERSGLPVVGVVPYMQIDIDDEDSLSPQLVQTNRPPAGKPVEIAVVRLPHLSNFTDFGAFARIPEVDLRYVSRPDALGFPDMIILPGTKNTMSDLAWLRQSGMAEAIRTCMKSGTDSLGYFPPVLFGICGGFQMLGKELCDPDGVETGKKNRKAALSGETTEIRESVPEDLEAERRTLANGLGFLDADTVFEKQKRRTQVRGRIETLPGILAPLSGLEIEGYEIHMGQTSARKEAGRFSGNTDQQTNASWFSGNTDQRTSTGRFSKITDLRNGTSAADGLATDNVYGTYVHGIFDAPGIAMKTAQILACRKGLKIMATEQQMADHHAFKETQYDLLADTLRTHLDMKKIYEILETGI